MKTKFLMPFVALGLILLLALILWLSRPKVVVVREPAQPVTPVVVEQRTTPEFRGPPLKVYAPLADYQQVGLLIGNGETLPLWGKPSLAYKGQWNYYTMTSGQQMYPLPVFSQNKDCSEDIGCYELYDNQDVTVTGRDDLTYKTKIYRTVSIRSPVW
jgi:hypothetical protein